MKAILTLVYSGNRTKTFHDFNLIEESWRNWCLDGSWPPELQTLSCEDMYGVISIKIEV